MDRKSRLTEETIGNSWCTGKGPCISSANVYVVTISVVRPREEETKLSGILPLRILCLFAIQRLIRGLARVHQRVQEDVAPVDAARDRLLADECEAPSQQLRIAQLQHATSRSIESTDSVRYQRLTRKESKVTSTRVTYRLVLLAELLNVRARSMGKWNSDETSCLHRTASSKPHGRKRRNTRLT